MRVIPPERGAAERRQPRRAHRSPDQNRVEARQGPRRRTVQYRQRYGSDTERFEETRRGRPRRGRPRHRQRHRYPTRYEVPRRLRLLRASASPEALSDASRSALERLALGVESIRRLRELERRHPQTVATQRFPRNPPRTPLVKRVIPSHTTTQPAPAATRRHKHRNSPGTANSAHKRAPVARFPKVPTIYISSAALWTPVLEPLEPRGLFPLCCKENRRSLVSRAALGPQPLAAPWRRPAAHRAASWPCPGGRPAQHQQSAIAE